MASVISQNDAYARRCTAGSQTSCWVNNDEISGNQTRGSIGASTDTHHGVSAIVTFFQFGDHSTTGGVWTSSPHSTNTVIARSPWIQRVTTGTFTPMATIGQSAVGN